MRWPLPSGKGKGIVRKYVWAISDDEIPQPSIKEKLVKFDKSVKLAHDHE
jgi:hypothetical protein